MKDIITIRVLNLDDSIINAAAIRMVRRSVIPGGITYYYDREPDYRSFASLQGISYVLYGAQNQKDSLLGITQITFNQVYWNGTLQRIAYSGDTRVDPVARGQRLADRLIEVSCDQGIPVFGAVLGDNHMVLNKKLADWNKCGIQFKIVGELQTLFCKTQKINWTKHTRDQATVEIAREADLDEMYTLWKTEKIGQNLAKAYPSFEAFRSSYLEVKGVSLDTTLVLKRAGKILGFTSIWNQESVRRIQIKELTRPYRLARFFLRPFIRIPGAGEELEVVYSYQHCFANEVVALRPKLAKWLIDCSRSKACESGAVIFSMGVDTNDPLFPILKSSSVFIKTAKLICHDPAHALKFTPGAYFHLEVGMG
jgi:hypothetical protein